MTPTERRMAIVPASRSTSRHRSASSSPRRIPVMASTCQGACSGLLSADQSRKARSWLASHGCISGALACFAVGGLAFTAGLRSSSGASSSTAAAIAALMIVEMYLTVLGDSGSPVRSPF